MKASGEGEIGPIGRGRLLQRPDWDWLVKGGEIRLVRINEKVTPEQTQQTSTRSRASGNVNFSVVFKVFQVFFFIRGGVETMQLIHLGDLAVQ